MEIAITSEVDNKLLNRREIEFEILGTGATPSRREVKKALCAKLGADEELIVIDYIKQWFGKRVTGRAKIYANKDALAIEPEYKLKRDKKGEEKKEGEAKEGAKETKQGEEKKEEAKEEQKPEQKSEEKA